MEARIPKRVGLELSGPDEPLIYEITFTEKVSCRGARVEALDQLWTKTPIFYATRSALSSARATESTRFMVGAVGIEPTTFGLKGRCSTTELRPCGANF